MIAIIGKPGVGKSTLLKKLAKNGYKVLNTDTFFNTSYKNGNEGYNIIKKNLGINFVTDQEVNKQKLREFIKKNPKNIEKIEILVYPILIKHLQNNIYDFVEIPNLATKKANFTDFFTKIIKLTDENKNIKKRLKKRVVDKSNINLISTIYKEYNDKNIVEIDVNVALNLTFFKKIIN